MTEPLLHIRSLVDPEAKKVSASQEGPNAYVVRGPEKPHPIEALDAITRYLKGDPKRDA